MSFAQTYRPPIGGSGDGTIVTSDDFDGTGASGAPLQLRTARVGFISGETVGIVADDTTDDRQNIYDALDQCATLGADLLLPPRSIAVGRDPAAFALLDLTNRRDVTIRGVKGKTVIRSLPAQATASGPCVMVKIANCSNVTIEGIHFDGYWGNAHTVVSERSHLQDLSSLPSGLLYVHDTTHFPSSGTAIVVTESGTQSIAWSSKTSSTLTITSGTGIVRSGDSIGLFDKSQGATTVASGSNGQLLPLSGATLNVESTAKFPDSLGAGKCRLQTASGYVQITYTSKTGSTLKGVISSGGTGTLLTGYSVQYVDGAGNHESIAAMQVDPKNHAIFIYGSDGNYSAPNRNTTIRDCTFHGIYGDCVWIGAYSYDTLIENCHGETIARNGVTLSSFADGVTIRDSSFTNIFTSAIDSEPVDVYTRNVTIDNCDLDHWFNPTFEDNSFDVANIALSIQGGSVGRPAEWTYTRNWRVSNTRVRGSILITTAKDVRIDNCEIVADFDGQSFAPVVVGMNAQDVVISNSFIYGSTGNTSQWNYGSVSIADYITAVGQSVQPGNVTLINCDIHARNGMHGVYAQRTGGYSGLSGTATAYTPPSSPSNQGQLTFSGTPFSGISGRYNWHQVVIGDAIANIVGDNGSNILYVAPIFENYAAGLAWTDRFGRAVADPDVSSPVAATILPTGGVLDIQNCRVDCTNPDGSTSKGARGIFLTTTDTWATGLNHMRARIRGNTIRGADTYGIDIYLETSGDVKIKSLEIVGNHAWDDQVAPTCTTGIRIQNPEMVKAGGLTFYGNTEGDGIDKVAGLDAGSWFTGGYPETWAGYENPDGLIYAPPSAIYSHLGQGEVYRKVSAATLSTGWTRTKSSPRTLVRSVGTRKSSNGSAIAFVDGDMPHSVPGDLQILIVNHGDGSVMTTPSLSVAAGFTLYADADEDVAGVYQRGAIFIRRYTPGAGNPTVAARGTSSAAMILSIKDAVGVAATSEQNDNTFQASPTNTITLPGVTTVDLDTQLLHIITWFDGGGAGAGSVGSWSATGQDEGSEIYDAVAAAGGSFLGIAIYSARDAAPGVLANTTAVISNPNYAIWSAFTLAFSPVIERPAGVATDAASIHAALVSAGIIIP